MPIHSFASPRRRRSPSRPVLAEPDPSANLMKLETVALRSMSGRGLVRCGVEGTDVQVTEEPSLRS